VIAFIMARREGPAEPDPLEEKAEEILSDDTPIK
jgi:hypothetical protein